MGGGRRREAEEQAVTGADLRAALDRLSPVPVGAEIGAVSVGTPHASVRSSDASPTSCAQTRRASRST